MVQFARHTGQSLMDIIERWHPRDMDTWIALDEQDGQEARFAQLRREHGEQYGR